MKDKNDNFENDIISPIGLNKESLNQKKKMFSLQDELLFDKVLTSKINNINSSILDNNNEFTSKYKRNLEKINEEY